MVVYLVENDEPGIRSIQGPTTELEVAPVYMDVYNHGFLYVNNLPHKPVLATDLKTENGGSAEVSRYNLYNEAEGQEAVEYMVGELFGELAVSEGFQSSVQTIIQDFGENLFVYLANPQHKTHYSLYEYNENNERVAVGKQPIAIPVLDVKVHAMLDGDKLLTGLEYFWDSNLQMQGEPREAIQAGEAVMAAMEVLNAYFNEEPPLLTVYQITFAYIQDRSSHTRLVPVWLFDAWYSRKAVQENTSPLSQVPYVTGMESAPLPFAVNALNREVYVYSD
jgi:hypothetical protein